MDGPGKRDPELERSVLAAGMATTSMLQALAETGLQPDHFADARYAETWSAMLRLLGRGEVADVLTVGAELERSGFSVLVDEARWAGAQVVPNLAQAPTYARRVIEMSNWRRASRALPAVVDALEHESRTDLREALAPFSALLRGRAAA